MNKAVRYTEKLEPLITSSELMAFQNSKRKKPVDALSQGHKRQLPNKRLKPSQILPENHKTHTSEDVPATDTLLATKYERRLNVNRREDPSNRRVVSRDKTGFKRTKFVPKAPREDGRHLKKFGDRKKVLEKCRNTSKTEDSCRSLNERSTCRSWNSVNQKQEKERYLGMLRKHLAALEERTAILEEELDLAKQINERLRSSLL